MAGKAWTEEKRAKIAAAKALSKEKRLDNQESAMLHKDKVIPIPLPPIIQKIINEGGLKPPTDPSMTAPEEVFSADELLERATRLEKLKEAQVKKVKQEESLVKDNALSLNKNPSFTNQVTDSRGITTKYLVNPKNVPQGTNPTPTKYATVAELVKDLESKGASADQISSAIDGFTGGGMHTPSLADIEKMNPLNKILNQNSVVKESHTAIIESLEENKAEDQEYEPKLGKGSMKLLFPTMKQTNPATCWALVQTAKKFGQRLNLDMESGDSMIVNSRNKLASRFLESGEEWSIWLDDDMIPQTGNANWFRYQTFCDTWADSTGYRKITDEALSVHFIDRLLSHGQKIVGATYFGRQPTGRPMFHEGIGTVEINRESRNYPNQLFATQWVGTGCLLIHRSVYLDMQKAYPQLAPTTLMPQWDFFRLIPDKGEDASFCDRAIKIGHQPYVDLGLHCAHVGNCAYGAWNTNNKQLGV